MTAGILSVCTVFYILKFILFYLSFLVHIAWSECLSICIPLTLVDGGWPKHVAALTNRFAAVYSVGAVQYSSLTHSHNLLQNNFTQNPHILVSIACFMRQVLRKL